MSHPDMSERETDRSEESRKDFAGRKALEAFGAYLDVELHRSRLTTEAYLRDIAEFSRFVTGKEAPPMQEAEGFHPTSITTNDIRAWLASLSRKGEAARTLRRKTQSLRAFFRYLKRLGIMADNPASDVILAKAPKPLPEFVKEGEMESLLDSPPEDTSTEEIRDRLIVEILYATGIRRAELAGLRDSDISFATREIRVTGKRSKERVIPLPEALMERIRDYMRRRDADFPDAATDTLIRSGAKSAGATVIYKAVHRLLGSTGASKKSPHVLRHTFATTMLNNGADLQTVKEFLGHASLATTQIYTHVSFAEMRRNYEHAHPRSERKDKKETK